MEDDLLINFSNIDFDSEESEIINREYWDEKVGIEPMKSIDKIYKHIIKIDENIKLNYTVGYIGFMNKNKIDNFIVLNPKVEWVSFNIRIKNAEEWYNNLINNNIDCYAIGKKSKRLKLRIPHTRIDTELNKIDDLIIQSFSN